MVRFMIGDETRWFLTSSSSSAGKVFQLVTFLPFPPLWLRADPLGSSVLSLTLYSDRERAMKRESSLSPPIHPLSLPFFLRLLLLPLFLPSLPHVNNSSICHFLETPNQTREKEGLCLGYPAAKQEQKGRKKKERKKKMDSFYFVI